MIVERKVWPVTNSVGLYALKKINNFKNVWNIVAWKNNIFSYIILTEIAIILLEGICLKWSLCLYLLLFVILI